MALIRTGRRKGQSAIEYLTTYGWMLLVIAIVGGAIFTTVQNQSNLQTVSGFSGAAVTVENFALTGNGALAMEITAQGSSPVKITNVTIAEQDTGNIAYATSSDIEGGYAPLGESKQVNITQPGVTSGDSTRQFNVTIDYRTRSLPGLQASGSMADSLDITG